MCICALHVSLFSVVKRSESPKALCKFPIIVITSSKLQELFYDIRPPTTAITDYAMSLERLSAKKSCGLCTLSLWLCPSQLMKH